MTRDQLYLLKTENAFTSKPYLMHGKREKEKKEILGKAALLNGGGGVDSDRIDPTKKDKSTT